MLANEGFLPRVEAQVVKELSKVRSYMTADFSPFVQVLTDHKPAYLIGFVLAGLDEKEDIVVFSRDLVRETKKPRIEDLTRDYGHL